MTPAQLKLLSPPTLTNGTLLLALTGWMDGGQVSTGTVKHLMGMGRRTNRRIARIEPDDFYIYNFPGDMETSALFRPHVHYDAGLVKAFDFPTNTFYCDEPANLLFFVGKEPNLKWQAFADCIFAVTTALKVSRIIFIGSFGGSVPHTREPRLFASVSDEKLLDLAKQYRLRLSEYEGPGSFATLLLHEAPRHNVQMMSLAAEIPGYLDGINPLSIEAVTRRLGPMLNLPIDLDALRDASNDWEIRVSAAVEKDEELAETVRKLEEQYDDELISEGS